MSTLEMLASRREEIERLARTRGAAHVRVFGSVARGSDDEASDLDFLVNLDPGRSLLDLGALQMDLEALLQRKVDLVTEAGLRPRIRQRVLSEARPL